MTFRNDTLNYLDAELEPTTRLELIIDGPRGFRGYRTTVDEANAYIDVYDQAAGMCETLDDADHAYYVVDARLTRVLDACDNRAGVAERVAAAARDYALRGKFEEARAILNAYPTDGDLEAAERLSRAQDLTDGGSYVDHAGERIDR